MAVGQAKREIGGQKVATRPHRRTATAPKAEFAVDSASKAEFLNLSIGWAAPSMRTIDQVREGLSLTILEGLNSVLPGITYRIVPKSTLAALKTRSDRLPLEPSNRVYQASKVVGFAMTIYRDEGKVREFLTRSHPMLEDRTPLDVALESGAGADMVINLLGRGAYGGGA